MLISARTLWLSLLLILLSCGSIYLAFSSGITLNPARNQNHLNGYMTNASYYQYNKDGELASYLQSHNIRRYSYQNSSEFEDPQILIYNDQTVPWEITAKFGKSIHGTNKVDLWDNVVVHRAPTNTDAETTITTSALTVYLQAQQAETDKPVTITQPHAITQSTGFKTDFKTGVMQLSSNARGVYEPKSNHSTHH